MLERWMPFGTFAAANPVFGFGVRRLRFGRSAQTLNRRSWRIIGFSLGVTLLLWVLMVGGEYVGNGCATAEPFLCYYPLQNTSVQFAVGLLLLSIGLDVLLDFACILAGYNTMRMATEAIHWDLLRMTPMQLDVIVGAQHAIVQTRAWLMTVLITSLRVAVVLFYLFTTFILPLIYRGSLGDFMTLGYGYDFVWLFTLVALFALGFVLIAEPLWRMRAMTALSLALAAQFREPVLGTLAGLGSVIGLWLAELIILGLLFYLTIIVATSTSFTFAPVFGSVTGGIAVWLFFRILKGRSLGRAIRYASPR